MSEPLVSIVLPSYNRAHLLPHAMDSVLAQTYQNWELVVVDDCSTDNTPDVVAGYAARDARIRPLRNEVNRRLPASLNIGFAAAGGEYFTWTSDDNLYRPEALSEMVAALEHHPEAALAYANFSVIDERDELIRTVGCDHLTEFEKGIEKRTQTIDRRPGSIFINNVVAYCFLYRRSVYEQVGGYAEDLFLAEDFEYWMRIGREHKLLHVDKDLYLAREHGGSLTSQRWAKVRVAGVAAMARNLPHMKWVTRQQYARVYSNMASDLAGIGDMSGARRHLGEAFRQSAWTTVRYAPPGLMLKMMLPAQVYAAGQAIWNRAASK